MKSNRKSSAVSTRVLLRGAGLAAKVRRGAPKEGDGTDRKESCNPANLSVGPGKLFHAERRRRKVFARGPNAVWD